MTDPNTNPSPEMLEAAREIQYLDAAIASLKHCRDRLADMVGDLDREITEKEGERKTAKETFHRTKAE